MKRRGKVIERVKDVTNTSPIAEGTDGMSPADFLEELFKEKMSTEIAKKRGTPTKFKNEFYRQAYYLARLGARDSDIADFFAVHLDTVEDWKATNPDFREAWLEGHMLFGMKIGETLGQRCLGYNFNEMEISQHIDRQGNIQTLKRVVTKHIPPDVNAIIFYLKNRFRESWSDTNRTEIEAHVQVDISKKLEASIKLLTPEEQALVKSIAIKNIALDHGISGN